SEFVRGVRENGGLATAKHFPGHGDTAADSHIDLPVIRADRARLDSLELIPFRAAISSQVDSVMTGHLNVPALEPDPNTPATLSHNILTDLLRKQLGYQGLIVTDAMDMGGITVRYAPGEAAVRAIAAGVDCLLMPPVPDAARAAAGVLRRSGTVSGRRFGTRIAFAIRFRHDAARGHAFCECFHFEIAAAGFLRRCDSRAFCARERPQGKRGCASGASRAGRTNLQNRKTSNHARIWKSVFD